MKSWRIASYLGLDTFSSWKQKQCRSRQPNASIHPTYSCIWMSALKGFMGHIFKHCDHPCSAQQHHPKQKSVALSASVTKETLYKRQYQKVGVTEKSIFKNITFRYLNEGNLSYPTYKAEKSIFRIITF
jgi:hypothetical protein